MLIDIRYISPYIRSPNFYLLTELICQYERGTITQKNPRPQKRFQHILYIGKQQNFAGVPRACCFMSQEPVRGFNALRRSDRSVGAYVLNCCACPEDR